MKTRMALTLVLSTLLTGMLVFVIQAEEPTAENIEASQTGQWNLLGQPSGGDITEIAITPHDHSQLFVGTKYGLFRSNNGGTIWSQALNGTMGVENEIFIHPASSHYIYVDRRYKSYNGGDSWDTLHEPNIAFDLTTAGILYSSHSCNGLRKSTDNGDSWLEMTNGLPNLCNGFGKTFAIDRVDGQTLYAYAPVAHENGNPTEYAIFRSHDGGDSWITATTVLSRTIGTSVIHPTNPDILYITQDIYPTYPAYQTTDGGQNWTRLPISKTRKLFIHPTSPQIHYLQTAYDLYRSANGGNSWQSIWQANGFDGYISQVKIHPTEADILYLESDSTIFYSADGGATWQTRLDLTNQENYITTFNLASSNPDWLYSGVIFRGRFSGGEDGHTTCYCGSRNRQIIKTEVVTLSQRSQRHPLDASESTYNRNGVLRSTDGGQTWSDVSAGLKAQNLNDILRHPLSDTTLYVQIYGSQTILESHNQGSNWQKSSNFSAMPAFSPDYRNDHTIYNQTGTPKRSTDGGTTWITITNGIMPNQYGSIWVGDLAIDPTVSNILYLVTSDTLYKTVDQGDNWELAVNGFHDEPQQLTIAPLDSMVLYAIAGDSYNPQKIYRSDDGASSWTLQADFDDYTYYGVTDLVVDAQNSSLIYANTGSMYDSGTIYKSMDGGTTWITPSLQMTNTYIIKLAADPNQANLLYALVRDSNNQIGGQLYKSTDGGYQWIPFSNDENTDKIQNFSLARGDDNTPYDIYAVTYRGEIWQYQYSRTQPTPTATTQVPTSTPTNQPTDTLPTPFPTIDPATYEPNDTCAQAKPINPDGVAQIHTFETPGDEDWLYFDGVAGVEYLIEVRIPPTSTVNSAVEMWDDCNQPGNFPDTPLVPDFRMTFKAPQDGRYYLKVTDEGPAGGDKQYHISVRSLPDSLPSGAVIIVAGKRRDGDPLQANIHSVTDAVYQLARNQGCTADQIHYLATDTTRPGVTGRSTGDQLRQAITEWAVGKVNANYPLTVFMMDHGANDKLYLDGPDEVITPLDLDAWFDQLEGQIPALKTNLIIEACNSGSWILPAQSVAKSGRVIVTSTGQDLDAFATNEGASFSDAFLSGLRQGMSLHPAFEEGLWAVSQATQQRAFQQTPWLDDNGNGQPNDSNEGRIAAKRIFGCQTTSSTDAYPPHITQAELKNLANNQGEFQVQVETNVGTIINRVWVVIYTPSANPDSNNEEDMVAEPAPLGLFRGSDGSYGSQYNFPENGQYRMVVYAESKAGLRSRPYEFTVTIGEASQPVYLPLLLK